MYCWAARYYFHQISLHFCLMFLFPAFACEGR